VSVQQDAARRGRGGKGGHGRMQVVTASTACFQESVFDKVGIAIKTKAI